MKQASFLIGISLNKDKNKLSKPSISVQKEVNKNIDKLSENENTTISDTKTYDKPRKLVENIYYLN